MSTKVEHVLKLVEALTAEERQEVRDALKRLEDVPPWATPLQRSLWAAGLVSEFGDPRKRAEHIRSFDPIKLAGEPLSEQIIRERR